MRSVKVATILLFLATSSTAVAATKAIEFGKLSRWDGTGVDQRRGHCRRRPRAKRRQW
jgi:hypothetical protein